MTGVISKLIDVVVDQIVDEKLIGWYGEKLSERELKLVNVFGRKGRTLRNIYIPKENGETTEIDLVYITQKGIFVLESKNYSGWIFGSEKDAYWTSKLPNGQSNRFFSPIKQNDVHIKWLKEYLGNDIPMFSFIIFSERCELKKVTVENKNVHVMKRDYIYKNVRSVWDETEDVLSEEKIEEIYNTLKDHTKVDKETKEAHVEAIKQKYDKKLCPRCGSELVLRTAKKGDNAGNQFWGCSSFPKCRYMESDK